MEFSNIEGIESLSEETLIIAKAIAWRDQIEGDVSDRIYAAIFGQELEVQPAYIQAAELLGQTALLLRRIEDPSKIVSQSEELEACMGEKGFAHMAQKFSQEEGLTYTSDGVRNATHIQMNEFQSRSGLDDEFFSNEFARKFAAAREVAVENQTDVATVFLDDELNLAAERRAFRPSHLVAMFEKGLAAVSTDMFNSMILQTFESLTPIEILEEQTPESIAEEAIRMQLDPLVEVLIAELTANSQEVIRQYFVYQIVKIWGLDELRNLSKEQKDNLLPRRELTHEVSKLVQLHMKK